MRKYKRNLSLIFLMQTIGALHFDRGIFILYLIHHGMTEAEISALQIWLFIVLLVMEVPSGVFADSFGRKGSLIMSGIFAAIYAIGMLFAQDFWLFFILFGILGTGFAFSSGADTAMLYDTLKVMKRSGQFTRINSRLLFAMNIAFAIGIGMGGYLQKWGGWELVYGAYFTFSVLTILIAAALIEPPFDKAHQEESHESYGSKWAELGRILRVPAMRHLMLFMLAMALFEAMIVPLHIYGQKLFAERGLAIDQVSLSYGLIEIIAATNFLLAPFWMRKIGIKNALYVAIIMTVALMPFLLIDQAWVSVLVFVLIFSLPEARRPMQESYVNDRIPSNLRASLISVESMMGSVLIVFAYAYYGLAALYTDLAHVMAWSALIGVVALAILVAYFRRENAVIKENGEAPSP